MQIECEPISWFKDRVKGLDDILSSKLVRDIIDSGCFIAGGFPRKLLRHGCVAGAFETTSALNGDIDIFCIDKSAAARCMATLASSLFQGMPIDVVWHPSPGKNAWQTMATMKFGNGATFFTKLQVVDAICGPPEDVISSFDFYNCMVAFNASEVCFHPSIVDLENARRLEYNPVSKQRYIGSRTAKYLKKYGYDSIGPNLFTMLNEWLKDRITNNDWGQFHGGEQIARALLSSMPSSLADDVVMPFIGKVLAYVPLAKMNYNVLARSYDQLVVQVDPFEIELIKRKAGLFTPEPGDLVRIPTTKIDGRDVNIALVVGPEPGTMTYDVILDGQRVHMSKQWFLELLSRV